jgi:hypothetical protein
MTDVLWVNTRRGSLAVWLMNGPQVLWPGPELPGLSGDGWNAVTVADFNRDGLPDVPWYNSGRSSIAVWLMNGTQVLWPGPDLHGPSGGGWEATATGDLNSDSMADVLWSNPGESSMIVWLMNGTQLLAPGPEIQGPRGGGWSPATSGDFNFDGMLDVLWYSPGKHAIAVWLMAGTQVLLPGPEIPGPGDRP